MYPSHAKGELPNSLYPPREYRKMEKDKKNYQFIDVRNLERTKVGTNTINARPKGQSNKV